MQTTTVACASRCLQTSRPTRAIVSLTLGGIDQLLFIWHEGSVLSPRVGLAHLFLDRMRARYLRSSSSSACVTDPRAAGARAELGPRDSAACSRESSFTTTGALT